MPVGFETRDVKWMGVPCMPFSRALAARVFALFNEGLPVQSVCALLVQRLQDIWRCHCALAPAVATAPAVTDDSDVSPDIQVLSLELMLTRLRSKLNLIQDDEVRLLKLKELHRCFVKNGRMLIHELAQLVPEGVA